MNRTVTSISSRLSLRAPQRTALEILADVTERIPLERERDLSACLAAVRGQYPSVTDFEREFPSLCFALATGVGKTRLMGAFIAYLREQYGIRHFFVLAPNLTIYEKLKQDFTPNTPKYVFHGIAEFATAPPELVTGDDYEKSRNLFYQRTAVEINIFNISKINAEVRGGKAPRIKRLSEYIGESYFEYLAGLNDLVLIMDESHRYRGTAGVRVLNELSPVLGLELTATPQIERSGASEPFRNIIYSYPLSEALRDGFVKEPAVATREDLDVSTLSPEQLERLKLEDGIHVHENAKVEIERYTRENGLPPVKPFLLVVAADTAEASRLKAFMESEDFFGGSYRGKVIEVHSSQRGEEKEENVQRLLRVEHPDEPTEIVIHVNMLKEGWDVTNLYTIVPLRAANSKTLVEQSIGRGLRLPFGKRTGVLAVDRLTVIAHDRFQEIIDHANDPNSIIRAGVVVGRDIPIERREIVEVPPRYEEIIQSAAGGTGAQPEFTFPEPQEQQIALETIRTISRLPSTLALADLARPEVIARVATEVEAAVMPAQAVIEGTRPPVQVRATVEKALRLYCNLTIDIPKIVITPKAGTQGVEYSDFHLDLRAVKPQPGGQDIIIQNLTDHERERIGADLPAADEPHVENYLVRALIDYDDINYDECAALLHRLAGQMTAHLQSYLPDAAAVRNVVIRHHRQLADLIQAQMGAHTRDRETEYEANVSPGFNTLRHTMMTVPAGEPTHNFRTPVERKLLIRGMLFGGFHRCLYSLVRFDSDGERRFAVLLEDEPDSSLKWLRPAKGQIRIFWGHESYTPDFIVETSREKLICEIKAANEMDDREVRLKAAAAEAWCRHATVHERSNHGKPWRYALIPDVEVRGNRSLASLISAFGLSAMSGS